MYAVLGIGLVLILATLAAAIYRLSKVRVTFAEGVIGFAFLLGLSAICVVLFGIEVGFRQMIYEGCLIRRSTPEYADFLIAIIFLLYGVFALGAYAWHLNSSAHAHATEKAGKSLGSSILDTLEFYRREPLVLATQATAFAGIHIFFNALIVSVILLQALQGLAFGTTNYDRFHTAAYAEGCLPYSSDHWKR